MIDNLSTTPQNFDPRQPMEIQWSWYTFAGISNDELYAILKLRQQVFIVEQSCIYLDCDNLDQNAWHLCGRMKAGTFTEPVAYLRIIYPGIIGELPVLGRLLTHPQMRGKGLGKMLLTEALQKMEVLYNGLSLQISAQNYLCRFYEYFGFQTVSDIYEEDGIPHIKMIRRPVKE